MAINNAETLLSAYVEGVFPMADEDTGEIYWYSPDPRAIIPINTYKPSKSLRPILSKSVFEIRLNTAFEEVIHACSKPRSEEDGVWISDKIIHMYTDLHHKGFAHSVESYFEGRLVGGLYGVSINSAFFGESMFYRKSNAAKVAFDFLINKLKGQNFTLLDTQFINDNVRRFGAIEISKSEYSELLNQAISKPNSFIV
ncbi:MAG: leucyl/phenylalanyl-tRNA--protein transferase [Leadbetterella sp.]